MYSNNYGLYQSEPLLFQLELAVIPFLSPGPREDLIREATAGPTSPPTTAPPTTAPPTLPPTLSPVPLQDNTETSPAETEPGYDEMSCVGFHSNPLPDSFLLSSTNGRMNFLKLGSLGAPEISIR